MTMEGFPKKAQPKLTLDQLVSETPVSGIGYERFSEAEQKDLDALLSSNGASLTDPMLKNLTGEELMDMMEYVHAKPNTPERAMSGARIKETLTRLMEQSGEEDYRQAA